MDFNIKQNIGLATIFFIVIMYGITIPKMTTAIVKFCILNSEPSEAYKSYDNLRLPVYWLLGAIQLVYLYLINTRIKRKKK